MALASAVSHVGVASVTAQEPGSALSESMHVERCAWQIEVHVVAVVETCTKRQVVVVELQRR